MYIYKYVYKYVYKEFFIVCSPCPLYGSFLISDGEEITPPQ